MNGPSQITSETASIKLCTYLQAVVLQLQGLVVPLKAGTRNWFSKYSKVKKF